MSATGSGDERAFSVTRDAASAPFFDAAADGRLLIRRCPVCGTYYPPQQRRCRDSDTLEWAEASGGGTLVTWAVDHVPALDESLAAPGGTGSVFGIVELDEGPWWQVAIAGTDPDRLAAGAPMVVRYVRPGGGEAVPVFTLA